jgi:hypothetical protein
LFQRFHFAAVLLLGCAVASAQVESLPSKLRISDTELARCDDAVTGRSSGGEVGGTLLFTEGVFQWGTDTAEIFVRFFDAGRATFSDENFIAKAFSNHLNRTSIPVLEPKGFALDGEIILSAAPFFSEGEDQPEEDTCVRQKGLWLFEPKEQSWSILPENYKVQRFGKYLIGDHTVGMDSSATHGAVPPTDRPASPSAPAQSTPPTPPPLTIRKSPRR